MTGVSPASPEPDQPATRPSRMAPGVSLVVFFLLAYALTWMCWLPMVASAVGWISLPVASEILATLGQFGPILAAFVMAGADRGVGGLRDLLRRLVLWRVKPVWFGVALFLPPTLSLTAIGTSAVLAGQSPDIPWPAVTHNLVPQFLYILLLGGPLGEEAGWRGFALPRLQAVCSPLAATPPGT